MTKATAQTLPAPSFSPDQEGGLTRYLQEIKRFPMLSVEEEFGLARRWQEQGDSVAAQKLVTSHLRLVAKIASGFRGYGLPISELISEGNIGLMQAVKRFDVERGFRLSTYAMWWIRASIQEYILRSWSLVKIGTTAAQKKLFFNLKRLKSKLDAFEDGDLAPETVKSIATHLMVEEKEVVMMNRRLSGGDVSLNAPISHQADGDGEWIDLLEDDSSTPEQIAVGNQLQSHHHNMLEQAMQVLNPREVEIIRARRLLDPVKTLEELSQKLGVSRERIRQIEVRAFDKLQAKMLSLSGQRA
ncbi:MAG: RNA polymerase sigma factor RpoH [Alphaproteobacteria bacterium]